MKNNQDNTVALPALHRTAAGSTHSPGNRDEWPEAPEEVFIGADPLHGKEHRA